MTANVKITLAQYLADTDPDELIKEAAGQAADIIVFPEMWSNGYASFDDKDPQSEAQWRANAVALNSPYVESFQDAARDHNIAVVTTFLEAGDPDPFNAALLINPLGVAVLHHRKVHTCFFDTPESALGKG